MESLFLNGPAGRLEALLEEPDGEAPGEVALVCHPHPQHGGTMHNKVVYRIARGLRAAGAAVLRFNYRGVNLSAGAYDRGVGELADARAALQFLRGRYPELPFTLAGFSFGSRIALRLGCPLEGVRRVIAVGFPAVGQDHAWLETCNRPKIFVQSMHDEFGPVPDLESVFARLPEPKRLVLIDAGNHFFAGSLEQLEAEIRGL
ncbi:MAG: alpha/beta hydrolase, partial [Pseudomonadota bacterium]